MQRVKKILLWVLLAFAVYAIFTSPDQAADIVQDVLATSSPTAFKSIGAFFDALLSRGSRGPWRAR